ncbi:MAG: phosphatase PAP2 family protein [Phycisphaerales bacterium]
MSVHRNVNLVHLRAPGRAGSSRSILGLLQRPMTGFSASIVLIVGLAVAASIIPLDRWVMTHLSSFGGIGKKLGGDIARELQFLQQFGAFTSIVLISLVIIFQDSRNRVRVCDLAGAMMCNALVCNLFKIMLGRPRPRIIFGAENGLPPQAGFDSTSHFAFFWSQYPLPRDGDPATPGVQLTHVMAYSWDFFKDISSDLWSMPSSHAAASACAAAVLMRIYPRLTVLFLVLAFLVGLARILFGAHYLSDVVFGWSVGFVIGALAMDTRIFSRLLTKHP